MSKSSFQKFTKCLLMGLGLSLIFLPRITYAGPVFGFWSDQSQQCGSFGFVQSLDAGYQWSGGVVSDALPSNETAGNLLVLMAWYYSGLEGHTNTTIRSMPR